VSRRRQKNLARERRASITTPTERPIVTIAQYGPDDKTVTKVVASVVRNRDGHVIALKRWMGVDVAVSEKVWSELFEFVDAQPVVAVVVTKGVAGCVHEEGEDYPEGQSCPFCPFWADRDRWATASPSAMTIAEFRRRRLGLL
jgi:hypothetical protein